VHLVLRRVYADLVPRLAQQEGRHRRCPLIGLEPPHPATDSPFPWMSEVVDLTEAAATGSGIIVHMSLSSADRQRVRAFFPDGEEVQYMFPARIPTSVPGSFVIAVSRQSILVISTGFRSNTRPKSVWARFNRNILGPVDMTLIPSFTLGGVTYEVNEEYVSVINAADAELRSSTFLPPDPLPDL
jgi:hypothetical protein